ncbi:hypothetical protein J7T55_005943 [Diaporthe amygdali]|uniref:uncharacterized protein n=1 Tax=Phomopsis amygdali TaxID=1214568 RepID=UPI0022FE9097|nr:uncharacterized protein J7T55_005943 [Diaporthe amygdali]KAJ0124604.1 hypothetical protein J7T55_005943 [Diaporthe amygdali]
MPSSEYFSYMLPQEIPKTLQSFKGTIGLAWGGLVAYSVAIVVYRLWFHPLSKIPGPKLLAVTDLPYLYQEHVQGSWPRRVTKLHRQYGHIVRISPNRLAVDGSIAWSQVYGHRHGKEEFGKVRNYFFPGDEITLIQGNLENHRRQRRQLAPGFSDVALTKQEPILIRHISKLIRKLDDSTRRRESVDMTRWLTLMTFDVISDLVFTDGFHSLDDAKYEDWAVGSFQAMRGQAFRRFMDALPLLRPLIGLLMSTDDVKHNDRRRQLAAVTAMDKIRSAAQEPSKDKRWDLISLMLGKNEDGERRVHEHELLANVSILLPAGSETTATALCGIFYYLGRHPEVYKILAHEIRTAFNSESDINIKSTARLPYLVAVIEEVLRIYPPGAETPPRVSPGDVVGGFYIPKGTSVSTYQWASFHNPENFAEPDSFHPERWLSPSHPLYDHRFDRDNRFVFKPFSFGPRDCIGRTLAYSEMRIFFSRVMYHFDFVLDGDYDNWLDSQPIYLVWGKGPLMVKFTSRTPDDQS